MKGLVEGEVINSDGQVENEYGGRDANAEGAGGKQELAK